MPFTLAHPAVLLPLLRRTKYFSATALIVGSLVPDVEFIGRLQESQNYAHHFPGIIIFNIPIGILLCLFFHYIIKHTLFDNLPTFIQQRYASYININWGVYALKNWFIVLSSLCLGILSHMLWDAFTHRNDLFFQLIPSLRTDIFFIWAYMPLYHVLQIISSVLGLLALVYFILKQSPENRMAKKINWNYWLMFILLFGLIAFIRFYVTNLSNGFWDVILALMGTGMYSIILNSLIHFVWLHKLKKPEP